MANSYEGLKVWKASMRLAKDVYAVSNSGALGSDWGLRDQIRRSAVSIPSNIAEGFERGSSKDFARFLSIAKGSAGELRTQIMLCKSTGHLTDHVADDLVDRCSQISRMLMGLIASIRAREIG